MAKKVDEAPGKCFYCGDTHAETVDALKKCREIVISGQQRYYITPAGIEALKQQEEAEKKLKSEGVYTAGCHE